MLDVAPETRERVADARQAEGISFAELGSESCRFPIGDYSFGDEGPWRFCGAPKAENHPYCPHHVRIAYIRPVR